MSSFSRANEHGLNNGRSAEYQPTVIGSPISDTAPPEQEISLREIIEILMKGRWVILITFLAVLGVVAAYTFMIKPEYEAVTMIKIDTEKSGGGSADMAQLMGFTSANRNINNEIAMLKSRSLSRKVATQILESRSGKGGQSPILEPDNNGRITERAVAARILKNVDVKQVNPDVDLIEVKFTSNSPQEAQFVADTYVRTYQDWRLESTRESVSMARQFLEKQYEQLNETLKGSEQELESFLENKNVVQLDEEARQLVQQANEIKLESDKASVDYEVARAQLNGLQRQLEPNKAGLRNRVSSTADQEIALLKSRIAALQTQREEGLAELNRDPEWRTKANQHQRITDLNAQLNQLIRRLDSVSDQFMQESAATVIGPGSAQDPTGIKEALGYENQLRRQIIEKEIEVSGLSARKNVLGNRLGEYQSRLSTMPGTSIQLAQLQRDREGKTKLYEYVTNKLQEARAAETATVGGIQIVDTADVPMLPVRPNRLLNLFIGAILGLALGIGIVFVRNALDDVIRKPEDLRKRGHSVLGIIPSMERIIRTDFAGKDKIVFDNKNISTSLLSLLNPLSPIAESYRRFRTNVEYSKLDTPIQTLMVTSPAPGDGKTVTALNLAIALAQSGRRTIYIDADLRRPTGHKMIEVPKDPGLVEVLFEVHPFRPEDFYTGIEDLYLLPAGSMVPNPAELLASKKMRDFVLQLRNEFDVIIFDTPPVLAVSDAGLLVNQADAAILVLSAGETTWQGLERSMENMISNTGARLTGVVLNRFDPKTAYGYYSYYNSYDSYYSNYYGYGGYRDATKASQENASAKKL